MNLTTGIAAIGVALLLAVTPCLPQQTSGDKQPELALHLQKAQQHLRAKRPDLAIPELQAAVAIDPENVETQGNLGVLLFFQGKFSDAIPHLRAAVDKQSSLANIQGLLGIAELRTSDFAAARKDLETSFPTIPDKKFKTQAGLELLGLYAQTGNLDEAAAVVAELRKVDPGNAEVLYAAYRTYSDLTSESMLALALAAPESAQMHQVLAHEEIREGNKNGAIAQFRKAIAKEPGLPGVHFELAEALHASSDLAVRAQAEAEYRLAVAQNPRDVKGWTKLGDVAADKGRLDEAADDYRRASQILSTDTDAAIGMARVDLEKNDPAAAASLLESVVASDPSNVLAHYRLSAVYRRLNRPEDARRELDAYQKYKSLKENLRAIYKEMRIDAPSQ